MGRFTIATSQNMWPKLSSVGISCMIQTFYRERERAAAQQFLGMSLTTFNPRYIKRICLIIHNLDVHFPYNSIIFYHILSEFFSPQLQQLSKTNQSTSHPNQKFAICSIYLTLFRKNRRPNCCCAPPPPEVLLQGQQAQVDARKELAEARGLCGEVAAGAHADDLRNETRWKTLKFWGSGEGSNFEGKKNESTILKVESMIHPFSTFLRGWSMYQKNKRISMSLFKIGRQNRHLSKFWWTWTRDAWLKHFKSPEFPMPGTPCGW